MYNISVRKNEYIYANTCTGTTASPERAFSLFIAAAKAGDRDANNNAGD
jgi:TPR repeat protein